MKKIAFLLFSLMLASCAYEDYELNEYKYTTVYCGIPNPVRTLIENEDEDIKVGVAIGGMRANLEDQWATFAVDPTLLEKHPQFELLPEKYYTLSDPSNITIGKGSLAAGVTLTFNMEEFMKDPLAHTNHYAFPFRIVESSLDSILVNKSSSITVVKYINQLDGVYAHKGVDKIFGGDGELKETIVYSKPDIQKNKIWRLKTTGARSLVTDGIGSLSGNDGNINISYDDNGAVTLESEAASLTYVQDACKYDKDKKILTLNYTFTSKGDRHEVSDTLIFRAHEMKFDVWD